MRGSPLSFQPPRLNTECVNRHHCESRLTGENEILTLYRHAIRGVRLRIRRPEDESAFVVDGVSALIFEKLLMFVLLNCYFLWISEVFL